MAYLERTISCALEGATLNYLCAEETAPFDFLVNGVLVRTSLGKFLLAQGLSAVSILLHLMILPVSSGGLWPTKHAFDAPKIPRANHGGVKNSLPTQSQPMLLHWEEARADKLNSWM